MDREIIIGRSSDLDMVLVEDMVSRKHAKISTNGGQVIIQDLGSTNGTFVNGEKIKRVRLREGDRILIGTSIIKLVSVDGVSSDAVPAMPPAAKSDELGVAQPTHSPKRTVSGARSMAGSIDEIPLPDLMQLLSTSKKSGVLEIQTGAQTGRIYMRKGQVYYATIEGAFDVNPRKAIYRMLCWDSGAFELQPPDDKEFLEELDEPTEGLLMEAMRQLDEIRRLEPDLPGREEALVITKPLVASLRELSPEQLDLVQLVHNYGKVSEVVDKAPTTDLKTYEALVVLLKQKVVTVA
ncbi:MAG: DUF4388 domain-containing protein [Myxococcales bacterium]|nr:DUF4388 domain-containing protein [Myxococcales bacterium]